MLADCPVDDDSADRFGYRDIADGLARLIEGEETATPVTIAVSAPWGAGKTSLMRLAENRVVRQRNNVARHATRCRDPQIRLWHPLPTSMLSPPERTRRKVWLGVALVFAVAIYFLAHGLIGPSLTDMEKVQAALGATLPAGSRLAGA